MLAYYRGGQLKDNVPSLPFPRPSRCQSPEGDSVSLVHHCFYIRPLLMDQGIVAK